MADQPACGDIQLKLRYKQPFDFDSLLRFFAKRAVNGIESVEAGVLHKRLSPESGLFVQQDHSGELLATVYGVEAAQIPAIEMRLRRMWDLDADPAAIHACLGEDPKLSLLVQRWPGLRLPAYWDCWESLLRAITGQQITIAAGKGLLEQLVVLYEASGGFGLPSPEALAKLDISSMGMPNSRKQTLLRAAAAVQSISSLDQVSPDDAEAELAKVKGIGPWTLSYWRMRVGGGTDQLPTGDVVLRKAALQQGIADDPKTLLKAAESWRPWRSYATTYLWQSTLVQNA